MTAYCHDKLARSACPRPCTCICATCLLYPLNATLWSVKQASCRNTAGAYSCGECPAGFKNNITVDEDGRLQGNRCELPEDEEGGDGLGAAAMVPIQPKIHVMLEIAPTFKLAHGVAYVEQLTALLTDSVINCTNLMQHEFVVTAAANQRRRRLQATIRSGSDSDSSSWDAAADLEIVPGLSIPPEPEPEPEPEPLPEPEPEPEPFIPDENTVSFDIVTFEPSGGARALVQLRQQLADENSTLWQHYDGAVWMPAQGIDTQYDCPRGSLPDSNNICRRCKKDEFSPDVGQSCRPCFDGQTNNPTTDGCQCKPPESACLARECQIAALDVASSADLQCLLQVIRSPSATQQQMSPPQKQALRGMRSIPLLAVAIMPHGAPRCATTTTTMPVGQTAGMNRLR